MIFIYNKATNVECDTELLRNSDDVGVLFVGTIHNKRLFQFLLQEVFIMVIDKVKSILAKHLGINAANIADDALVLEDLGANSLDVVEMAMSIEDELGVCIPDEDVINLRTVKDIADYIENNM